MENIEVNEIEYAYLKLISLFNTGKYRDYILFIWKEITLNKNIQKIFLWYLDKPSERQQLYKIQEKSVDEFKNHLIKECNNEHRIAILLLRLPILQSLQPHIIEEIFFSSLLGSFQIDEIIPQILKLRSSNAGNL